jgi:CBS domain-containing protein
LQRFHILYCSAIEWMLTRKVRHMPVLAGSSSNEEKSPTTQAAPPVESDSGSDEDTSDGTVAIDDAGERMPISKVATVLSLRSLLAHAIQVLEADEAVRAVGADAAQAAVTSARGVLDEASKAASDATAGGVAGQEAGGGNAAHDSSNSSSGAVTSAEGRLADAKTARSSITKAHAAFRLDLEDVLEWQRENGVEHLLNCRASDGVTAADAANEMAEAGVTSLVVVDEEGTVMGILTSRDYLWRVVAGQEPVAAAEAVAAAADGGEDENLLSSPLYDVPEGSASQAATIEGSGEVALERGVEIPRGAEAGDATAILVTDVMTSPVKTCKPSWSLVKAAKFMLRKRLRHIAVTTEDRKMLGIVSMSDLMRVMLAEDLASKEQQAGRVRVRRTRDFFNVRLLAGRKGVETATVVAAAPQEKRT